MVRAAYDSPWRRGVSSVACVLGRGGLAEEAPMFIDPEMLSRLRHRMMSVAYRMLGTVADAEDAVQDAFVRFQEAGGVSSPEGFLVRTTTRLCIDRLRARKRRGAPGPRGPRPARPKEPAPRRP